LALLLLYSAMSCRPSPLPSVPFCLCPILRSFCD